MCVCVSPMSSCLLGRYGSRCLQRDLPLPISSTQRLVQMGRSKGEELNNRFRDLSDEHLEGLVESKRVSNTEIRGGNRPFTPCSL